MFTEGEWWYQEDTLQKIESERNCKEFNIPVSEYKHISVHGTYPGGTLVAYCGCHKETEANARLISAAPDLYKACQQLVKEMQEYYYEQYGIRPEDKEDSTGVCIGLKAIAKAKGNL
jgi:hypothetical protein